MSDPSGREALAKVLYPNAWNDNSPWLPGAQNQQKAKAFRKADRILASLSSLGWVKADNVFSLAEIAARLPVSTNTLAELARMLVPDTTKEPDQ